MTPSTQKSGSGIGLAIATNLAIAATLLTNIFTNFFPPSGENIGQIANTVLQDVKIIPANYAFAIWGLIYIGLIAYGFYQHRQLRAEHRSEPSRSSQTNDSVIRRVDYLLIIACIAQMIWVYLFTLRLFWASVLLILAILLPLIGAYLQLNNQPFSRGRERVARRRQWMANIPFSVYLGWISVATIVNVASALYASGWNGWGISATGWTVIMLIVGTAIAANVAIRRVDIAFTLVFVWAYLAIAVRHASVPAIWVTAVIAAIVLAALLIWRRLQHPHTASDTRGDMQLKQSRPGQKRNDG
jgi:hypothetical protein